MKRIGQVIVVASATVLGATGIAAAEGLNFHVGPGGASVGINSHHHHHHRWHGSPYAYVPDCHWVTRRHWSRYRHAWVVERERVCD